MLGLATFFFVHDQTGSVAVAGLATGAETITGALGAGARGYLIDRYGQTKPLSILVPTWVVLIWVLTQQHTTVGIVAMCTIIGIFSPPINLSARPLWRKVAGAENLRTAYSIDSTIGNSTTLVGPVIATALALNVSSSVALWSVAGMMLVGGLLMITMPLSRSWVPEPEPKTALTLIKIRGIQILLLEGAIFGFAWGLLEITIPSASTLSGRPGLAAPLIAITAAMSIIAGLLIGNIFRNVTPLRGFKYTNTMIALCSLPLALTKPGWSMGIVLAAVGFSLGCASIYHMEVLEAIRPIGTATSAQAWQWAVEGSMIAVGAALGGYINQHAGTVPALLLFTCGMLTSTAFVWLIAVPRLQAADKLLTDEQIGQALADTESPAE